MTVQIFQGNLDRWMGVAGAGFHKIGPNDFRLAYKSMPDSMPITMDSSYLPSDFNARKFRSWTFVNLFSDGYYYLHPTVPPLHPPNPNTQITEYPGKATLIIVEAQNVDNEFFLKL